MLLWVPEVRMGGKMGWFSIYPLNLHGLGHFHPYMSQMIPTMSFKIITHDQKNFPKNWSIFFFQGSPLCIIFRFWSLRPQQGARTLQNHIPAYFLDGPHQSCKFRPDWSTLIFFSSKGPPFGYFPDFDKMQKSCIFCFSRYGPHFLTRYSGLPQEQF